MARSSGGSSAIEIIEKDDEMIKIVEMTMNEKDEIIELMRRIVEMTMDNEVVESARNEKIVENAMEMIESTRSEKMIETARRGW